MKSLLSCLACLSLSLVVGCGPAIQPSERPLFSNGSNTLTFLVYDAFTGAPVESATITLTAGTYELAVSKHTGNAYVVPQVPYGTHLATVEAAGYVGFLGQPSGDCNNTLGGPSSQCFKTYQVALYPQKGVESDVQVKAYEQENGAAVSAGTVVATLTSASNLIGTSFSNPLPGALTLRPSTIIASIAAGGVATLPKDKMVLGGTYSVDIFGAKSASNVYLTPSENQTFTAGKSYAQLTLFLGPPAQTPVALSSNNEKVSVQPNLTVSFPFPVEICSDPTTHTWTVWNGGADGNGDTIKATPATMNPVSAVVGEDGKLTVTANFATTPGGATTFQPADGLLEVRFNNLQLRVRGSSTCTNLTSIRIRDGAAVSPIVRMAAALP